MPGEILPEKVLQEMESSNIEVILNGKFKETKRKINLRINSFGRQTRTINVPCGEIENIWLIGIHYAWIEL